MTEFTILMKKVIRALASIVLLAAFFSGTTGISFYIHTCSENHHRTVYIFPELIKPAANCCSEDDIAPVNSGRNLPGEVIAVPCCKNEHLYLKCIFQSVSHSRPEFTGYHVKELPSSFLRVILYTPVALLHKVFIHTANPPPVSGRLLVFFLHQVRIPVPSLLS